jgi:transposase
MPNRVMALRFSRRLYRQRNLVERFFNKIKHYRAVATRYDLTLRQFPRRPKARFYPHLVAA